MFKRMAGNGAHQIQKVPRGKVAIVADFPTENYALQETVGQNPGTRMIS